MTALGDAYSAGAAAWAQGPERVYARLADALVAYSPVPLAGRRALDLGTGTGVASRAAMAAGARVIAADVAVGMLSEGRSTRPPGLVGDAVALPLRDDAVDVVVAAFALNHLPRPRVGIREAARVAPVLLASTYAADDDHPAKAAVTRALRAFGWDEPSWYSETKAAMAAWGTVELATAELEAGGMRVLAADHRSIVFDDLGAEQLVAWRLGMAQCAPFVARLSTARQDALFARALDELGPAPEPLTRRVLFLSAGRAR